MHTKAKGNVGNLPSPDVNKTSPSKGMQGEGFLGKDGRGMVVSIVNLEPGIDG